MSKNSGQNLEVEFSKTFHSVGQALLVSPLLLRTRNLGQIDLARLRKDKQGWLVEVGEVKSSEVGKQTFERAQKSRIISSQNFLASLFGFRTRFVSMSPENCRPV